MNFTITISQRIKPESLLALEALLNKKLFKFVFDTTYNSINAFVQRHQNDSLFNGFNLNNIIAPNEKETLVLSVNIPPFFYPYDEVDNDIVFDYDVLKKGYHPDLYEFKRKSVLSYTGDLVRIEVYNYQSEIVECDIHTLKGHDLEANYPNAPKRFNQLHTVFDYFVYMVFYFSNGEKLVFERPESEYFMKIHYDNADTVLGFIKTSVNDETNDLTYKLVHTIGE